jgi:hypothetical protein
MWPDVEEDAVVGSTAASIAERMLLFVHGDPACFGCVAVVAAAV